MSVVSATKTNDKSLSDDSRNFTFNVSGKDNIKAALELFGSNGTMVGIAALTAFAAQAAAQNETIAAAKDPTGQLCREAIGYCKSPQFSEWLESLGYGQSSYDKEVDESNAKEIILQLSQGVEQLTSRRQLDISGNSERFIEYVRTPYRAWLNKA